MKLLLDPFTVAAAVYVMSEAECDAMQRLCGDDPFRISDYLVEKFGGLDKLHENAANYRAEAQAAIRRVVDEARDDAGDARR